ncbi:hypothetical protein [Paraconexibacter sp. AEG42_29]|uniref:hypothetical protein n=1 Tax=Paraconexibacter sp. AEG42_29 TaxID=2997339 RepID=UPI00339D4804
MLTVVLGGCGDERPCVGVAVTGKEVQPTSTIGGTATGAYAKFTRPTERQVCGWLGAPDRVEVRKHETFWRYSSGRFVTFENRQMTGSGQGDPFDQKPGRIVGG